MAKIVEEQPAFLLHSRKYTDSRILLEWLTRDYGKLSSVLRVNAKKSNIPQPFGSYLLSWRGRSSLKTLSHVEVYRQPLYLQSKALYCGFYLNELLLRLLPAEDSAASIFDDYAQAIDSLSCDATREDSTLIEVTLRDFELRLLGELGFALNFFEDAEQNAIEGEGSAYLYVDGQGFVKVAPGTPNSYPSAVIIALREGHLSSKEVLSHAKRLCRAALAPLLGGKPLKSRELFR